MVLLHPELYTDEELFIANEECNAEQREQLAKLRQSPRVSWSRASAENYRGAIVSLKRMLDSGPATAEKWAMLASVAFKLGDIASGLKALETAECINPNRPLTRRVREQYPSMAGTATGGLAFAPLAMWQAGRNRITSKGD
jgi:hypothetical protein